MGNNTKEFSSHVCKELQNYVYRLIDPRNGETFYIGKGVDNRVFAHISDQLNLENFEEGQDATTEKVGRIRSILESGFHVLHVIHRHGMNEQTALAVEAALIDAYPGLVNIQGGKDSGLFGPMHSEQIIQKYELPELDHNPPHKLILISLNRNPDAEERLSLYDQVRFAWRISKRKAQEADFVIAVSRGITLGIFKPKEWLKAHQDNFPSLALDNDSDRWGFIGEELNSGEIREFYIGTHGKRISNKDMRHVQYPIRYWNIT